MNKISTKQSGFLLIVGIFLITTTMILHPVGGSFEHIIRISKINMITHSIAIFSVPFLFMGFYGLTETLNKSEFLSKLALSFMSFGLVTVILAAAVNGIVLGLFLNKIGIPDLQNNEKTVHLITSYGFMFNRAMDYIFITFSLIAIVLWSWQMLKEIHFSKLLAYLGFILFLEFITLCLVGIDLIQLSAFRIFVFSLVVWYLWTAISLIKIKS